MAVADNGNVIIGWSDSGSALTLASLQQATWTMYDANGNALTAVRTIQSLHPEVFNPSTIDSRFLSFYRSDGTPTPNYGAWGPKIKANLFGAGAGMGGSAGYLLLEVVEMGPIILDDSPPEPYFGLTAGDVPAVQLLNNDGSKAAEVLSGYTDADAQPAGVVRMADWEYLSDGNILIVGESRQPNDLVNRFGGASPGEHVVFRIVRPDGTEVVPLTLASANAVANSMWHGAGVTRGRFALRFDEGGAKVRIFNNNGTPVTGNLDLGVVAGNPLIAQGGRGDETGFHGNGADAYVNVNSAPDPGDGIRKAYITVLNADGTLRYSRVVTDDAALAGCSRVDGAIDAYGRALAVYEDAGGTTAGAKIVRGRLFKPDGTPLGGTFYVSEIETPADATLESRRPRAAWRGNQVAVAWESLNSPADPAVWIVAARFFSVPALGAPQDSGLTPLTDTFYVNPMNTSNPINNGGTESLGVAIANNGNVLIGWEDDGDGLTDLEAVWTLYDGQGTLLTADQTIRSLQTQFPDPITSHFLSYFRSDGSPIPARTSWGPKIKANPFGAGVGMGGTAFEIGLEISELADINLDDSGGGVGDFPTVQLVNNDGTPSITVPLSGYSDADAQTSGDVRIGDWEYLSDGNIVIVAESRQQADLVNRFGGNSPGNHATFRIVQRDGTEVVGLTLVSENAAGNGIWHGVGVTRRGFAVRFEEAGSAKVRLFRNDGSPVTGNIDVATLAGNPAVGQGGRGDSTGFHGNGEDAYLLVNAGTAVGESVRKTWVTVLNVDGTLRYSRVVSDDVPLAGSDRVDGAIDAFGRVLAIYDDAGGTSNSVRMVRGRIFNCDGSPASPTFYVSEKETPASIALEARQARVAWRGTNVAVVWQTLNHPTTASRVVAARLFSVAAVTPVTMSIGPDGTDVVIRWSGSGCLQSAPEVAGPWIPVPDAVSPYRTAAGGERKFFRVR